MIKVSRIIALGLCAALLLADAATAQEPAAAGAGATGVFMSSQGSGALGAGLVVIGAAFGIGKLAGAAVESMARQPETATTIQVSMIIAAALIEGFTFYALVICSGQNPWPAAG